jgi:hypothetical protein
MGYTCPWCEREQKYVVRQFKPEGPIDCCPECARELPPETLTSEGEKGKIGP